MNTRLNIRKKLVAVVFRMDPICLQERSEVYQEDTAIIKIQNKTENVVSTVEISPENVNLNEEQDQDQNKDSQSEDTILKHCSGMLIKTNIITTISGTLSSANSSLASSSETISSLSSRSELNYLPGCSRKLTDFHDDSMTTIKNMINPRILEFTETEPKINDSRLKVTVNSSCKGVKDCEHEDTGSSEINNEKIVENVDNDESSVRSDNCNDEEALISCDCSSVEAMSSRTSSNASSLGSSSSASQNGEASTSRQEDLESGYESKAEPDTQKAPIPSNFLQQFCDGDESDDEEAEEETLCTCLSPLEDDDECYSFEGNESFGGDDTGRLWRKRRFEGSPATPGSSPIKKFCSESSPSSSNANGEWPSTLASPNLVQSPLIQPEVKTWLNRFSSWSNSDRIQAIDALVNRCAANQVRHMMKSIEPLFQRDFISLLPKELALTVLGYLQPNDLLRSAQTCRYWRFLADDNLLWKEQCRRIGITTLKKRPRSLPPCASPWKAAYMRQYIIENNWLTRPVGEPIVMKGHDDHVITCLQFYGNRILSGSDDTTLKVWSAITGKCLKTLVGHSGGVWSSQMVGQLVISGSTDRTLRVWNAKTGECLKILVGHTSTVRCMHLHEDRVVSGSRDATLRVWSIPEGKCMKVLIGHLAAVRCVQYDGKVVVSGAYDYFVKVWNPDTGECLHTLSGHTNRVYSLQFDGVHVVSGSLDTSIRVWDVESGQLKHTLIGHQSLTSGMELHSNILVSGNADSTVKVWDINTGHCLHTLSGPNKHQSAVTCLQSSKRFVISSSDDGTVKLWDVRTGEFIRNLVELGSGGSGGVVWRIRASQTKLICAVGSRNGTEETKLLVLDFDVPGACRKCDD